MISGSAAEGPANSGSYRQTREVDMNGPGQPADRLGGAVVKYSLNDDGQGYRYKYSPHKEQVTLPEVDQRFMLRALLRDVEPMTLDELKAKIIAILPGAAFEVDSLGQVTI